MYPDIFESSTFSFRIKKFPCPHVSVFKSNLSIHTYLTSIRIHSSTQDLFLWEYWQQSLRRGCHLEYSIPSKQLGSILLSHRIKQTIRIYRPHDSGFIAYSKISTLELKKLRIRMSNSPDKCGRGHFWIGKEKVADSKISGYVCKGP